MLDCYDLTAVGLSKDDNMRAELFAATVENNIQSHAERVCSKADHEQRRRYYSDKTGKSAAVME